jgi:hypothetical protein
MVYIRKVREVTRALSIQKRSKFVKNEHAHYTVGARYLLKNTVIPLIHIQN